MAAEQKKEKQEAKPQVKEKKEMKQKAPKIEKEMSEESLIRISGYDVPGSRNIYTGLTRVKGVSWSISNAICLKLGFPKAKKISELTKEEITKIEDFLKKPDFKEFLKNRRFDLESGESRHIVGTELDIKKDFDIRRMKKIKSYKGIRHTMGQPVRGQRTRSHFRRGGRAVGVKRSK